MIRIIRARTLAALRQERLDALGAKSAAEHAARAALAEVPVPYCLTPAAEALLAVPAPREGDAVRPDQVMRLVLAASFLERARREHPDSHEAVQEADARVLAVIRDSAPAEVDEWARLDRLARESRPGGEV